MSEAPVKLIISVGKQKYEVLISLDMSLQDLKIEIEKVTQVTPENQRIIYGGRMIQTEKPLREYGMKEGNTVHMVAKKDPTPKTDTQTNTQQTNTPQSTQQDTTTQNTQQTNTQQTQDTTTQNTQGNTQKTDTQQNNTQQTTTDQNTQGNKGTGIQGLDPNTLAGIFSNPNMQQQVQQLLKNPEFLNELFDQNPYLQRLISTNPEMLNMLNNPNLSQNLTDPNFISQFLDNTNFGSQTQGEENFGSFGNLNLGNLFSEIQNTKGTNTQPQQPTQEEKYSVQLKQLNDMGFSNKEQNLKALTETGGSVERAIERLLG
jgi:ubiquilin